MARYSSYAAARRAQEQARLTVRWGGLQEFIGLPEALLNNLSLLGVPRHGLHYLLVLIALNYHHRYHKPYCPWPVVRASLRHLAGLTGLCRGAVRNMFECLERADLLVHYRPAPTSQNRFDLLHLVKKVERLAGFERATGGHWTDRRRWPQGGRFVRIPMALIMLATEIGLRCRDLTTLLGLVLAGYEQTTWPIVTATRRSLVPFTGLQPISIWGALHRLREAGLLEFDLKHRPETYDLSPLISILLAAEKPPDDPSVSPDLRERLRRNREWKAGLIERAGRNAPVPEERLPWVQERTVRVIIV